MIFPTRKHNVVAHSKPKMPRKHGFKSLFSCFTPKDNVSTASEWDFRDPTPSEFRRSASNARRPARIKTTSKASEATSTSTGPANASNTSGIALGAMSVGTPGLFTGSAPAPSIGPGPRPVGPSNRATPGPSKSNPFGSSTGKAPDPQASEREGAKTPTFPSKETAKSGGRPPKLAPPVAPPREYQREDRVLALPAFLREDDDHDGTTRLNAKKDIAVSSVPEARPERPKAKFVTKQPSMVDLPPPPPIPFGRPSSRPPTPISVPEHDEQGAPSNSVKHSKSMASMKSPSTVVSGGSGSPAPKNFSIPTGSPTPKIFCNKGTPVASPRTSFDGGNRDIAEDHKVIPRNVNNGTGGEGKMEKDWGPHVGGWPLGP